MAVVSIGIITISGASLAYALGADGLSGAYNQTPSTPPSRGFDRQSDVNVDLNSNSTTTNETNINSTTLRVNGENIEVPPNGEINKRIQSNGQTTDINVRSSTSQTSNSNSQSTDVNISSQSSGRSSTSVNIND